MEKVIQVKRLSLVKTQKEEITDYFGGGRRSKDIFTRPLSLKDLPCFTRTV